MKKYIMMIMVLTLLFCLQFGDKIPKEFWLNDIDILCNEFIKYHPKLQDESSKKIFIEKMDKVKKNIDILKDYEIKLSLSEVLMFLKDLHSDIVESSPEPNTDLDFYMFNMEFPVFFSNFGDDYYITAINEDNKKFLGAKLISVNGINIGNIEKIFKSLDYDENEQSIKVSTSYYLPYYKFLEFKKIAKDNKCVFTVEKESKKYDLPFTASSEINLKLVTNTNKSIPYSNNMRRSFYLWVELPEKNAVYFKINSMFSKQVYNDEIDKNANIPDFKSLCDSILDLLKTKKDYKLIIDVRHNGGGGHSYNFIWTDFLNQLSKNNDINRKDKLFIICGKNSCSAVLIFLYDFRKNSNATILGEIPMQSPNFYSGGKGILPNTKVEYKMGRGTKIILDKTGVNKFYPDIIIPEKAEDYFNGKDSILEYIISKY